MFNGNSSFYLILATKLAKISPLWEAFVINDGMKSDKQSVFLLIFMEGQFILFANLFYVMGQEGVNQNFQKHVSRCDGIINFIDIIIIRHTGFS